MKVKRLGLTKAQYVASAQLRHWCKCNRNRCYIPEWLLEEWGMKVDGRFFSGVACQEAMAFGLSRPQNKMAQAAIGRRCQGPSSLASIAPQLAELHRNRSSDEGSGDCDKPRL